MTVEGVPVVEVVEVDGIEDAAIVFASDGAEDCGASFIGVDVTGDGGIESCYGLSVQFGGVGFDPCFGLHVGGLGGDEGNEG